MTMDLLQRFVSRVRVRLQLFTHLSNGIRIIIGRVKQSVFGYAIGTADTSNTSNSEDKTLTTKFWKHCVKGSTSVRNVNFCPLAFETNVARSTAPNSLPLQCLHLLLTEDLINSLIIIINDRGQKKFELKDEKENGIKRCRDESNSNPNSETGSDNENKLSDNYTDRSDESDNQCFETLPMYRRLQSKYAYWEHGAPSNGMFDDSDSLPWQDVTLGEMYKFFLVLVSISIVSLAELRFYWEDFPLNGDYFRKIISRQRFFQIYDALVDVCDFDKDSSMHGFVESLVKNFSAAFYPGERLTVSELVTGSASAGWSYKEFNVDFPRNHLVKTFGLVDNETGFVVNLCNYYGPPHKGFDPLNMRCANRNKVLDKLLSPCCGGHHLSLGKVFSQVSVLTHLGEKFFYSGLMDVKCDSDIAKQVKKDLERLKVGGTKWLVDEDDENLIALHCAKRTKRLFALISNRAKTEMIMRNGNNVPVMINDFLAAQKSAKPMHYVMKNFGAFDSPVKCWSQRFFPWLFQIIQWNAFVLFTLSQDEKPPVSKSHHPFHNFKSLLSMELCRQAVKYDGDRSVESPDIDPRDINAQKCFCGRCFSGSDDWDENKEVRYWKTIKRFKIVFGIEPEVDEDNRNEESDSNCVNGDEEKRFW